MAKKKNSGKESPSPPLSPEEQTLLSRLLQDLEALAAGKPADQIPGPALAERLVQELPLQHPLTPELAAAIGRAFPLKTVQKAVKKKLFQLKQKGITPAEPPPEAVSAFSSTPEEADAYLGPIDAAGNRPVLLALPQGLSGVDLAMGVINDEKGIIDFLFGRYSRKKIREIKEAFFSKIPHMAETSISHAATVLEHAYLQEKENPGPPAGEYLRLRPRLLKNARLLDHPAVLDCIPLNSADPEMLTGGQIERLLHHELMASWVMDPARLKPLMEEIKRAEESPIFISESQRREHISTIKEEAIAKIFRKKDRETLRNRLQETAYLFFKIGEEPLARLCLAASLSLDQKDSLLKLNPLLNALVERSIASVPRPGPSSPLILR